MKFTKFIILIIFIFILVGCSSNLVQQNLPEYIDISTETVIQNLLDGKVSTAKRELDNQKKYYSQLSSDQISDYHFYRACIYMSKGNLELSKKEIEKSLEQNPDNINCLYTIILYYELFNIDSTVIEPLQDRLLKRYKSIQNSETYSDSLINISTMAYKGMNRTRFSAYGITHTHIFKFIRIGIKPDYALLQFFQFLEISAAETGQYEKAIDYAFQSMEYNTSQIQTYRRVAEYYQHLNNYKEAIIYYNLYTAEAVSGVGSLHNRAYCNIELKNYSSALEDLNLELFYIENPDSTKKVLESFYTPSYFERSENYIYIRRYFTDIYKVKTTSLYLKAICLEGLSRFDESLVTLDLLLKHNNKHHLGYLLRAKNYLYNKKDYKTSIRDLNIVLDLKPEEASAYYYLAVNYYELDKPAFAKSYLKKYFKKGASFNDAEYSSALLLLEDIEIHKTVKDL